MNAMTLKGNWNELKGKVREKWGKLTNNDLDQIQGRSEQLLGKVQRAYGLTKEEAQRQVDAFEKGCGCQEDRANAAKDQDDEEQDNEDLAMAGSVAETSDEALDESDDEDNTGRRRDRESNESEK